MQNFLIKHKIKEDILAVGVSGGADSMALVLMAQEQLNPLGIKIIALTVDHKLRPTSRQEAEYVSKIMQQFGIEHHILDWNDEKHECGIEESARIARYDLLNDWCKKHQVKCLMVAHHLRDQAETFLMRLQRGSGLDGLASIREVGKWKDLQILRPFLHTNPQDLEKYLQVKGIEWIHDESNDNENFLRVKMRKFLPEFIEKTGINLNKIDEAVCNLQSAEDFIEQCVKKEIQDKIQNYFEVVYSFDYSTFLSWHPEIKFRILAELCRRTYIPRADSVLNLINNLKILSFNGATLGGKEIILAYGKIWIIPELQAKRKQTRKDWKEFIKQNAQYKDLKIPHKAKLAILQKVKNESL